MKIIETSTIPPYFTGTIKTPTGRVEIYRDGKLHNLEGPARVYENTNESYFINGSELSPLTWKKAVSEIKKYTEEAEKEKNATNSSFVKNPLDLLNSKKIEKDKIITEFKTSDDIPLDFEGMAQYPNGQLENVIKVDNEHLVPDNFTGIVNCEKPASRNYYLDGNKHRVGGPAMLEKNGDQYWYVYGKLHRMDGPAYVCKSFKNSNQYWIDHVQFTKKEFEVINGNFIKTTDFTNVPKGFTGLVREEFNNYWFKNGQFHRENGPAIELHQERIYSWYKNGLRHRLNGPAVTFPCFKCEYWIEGVSYTQEEFYLEAEKIIQSNLTKKTSSASPKLKKEIEPIPPSKDFSDIFEEDEFDVGSNEYIRSISRKEGILKLKLSMLSTLKERGIFNAEIEKAIMGEDLSFIKEFEPFLTGQTLSKKQRVTNELKNNVKEATKRVAVKKAIDLLQNQLIAIATKGKNKKDARALKSKIEIVFASDVGKLLVCLSVGGLIPLVKEYLPESSHSILESVGEESRVQGLEIIGTHAVDFVTGPAFEMVKNLLTLEEPKDSEKVRVEVSSKEQDNEKHKDLNPSSKKKTNGSKIEESVDVGSRRTPVTTRSRH